jgi:hypothetical protein
LYTPGNRHEEGHAETSGELARLARLRQKLNFLQNLESL